MARALLIAVVVAVSWLGVPLAATPVSSAQTTSSTFAPEGGGIIPKPNSGTPPVSSGDRGGSAQIVLFVAIVAGLGVIGGLAWRSSVKARRAGDG